MPNIDALQPSNPEREYPTVISHIGGIYSELRVFYSATRDLGFPIYIPEFRPNLPTIVRTDTREMKKKLDSLRTEFLYSNLARLMQPISDGRPQELEAILNGAEPMRTLGIRQPLRHVVPVTELFLQEAFLRAYENNTQQIEIEKALPLSMFLSSNVFLEMRQTAQAKSRQLYEELIEDGVTPITQAHMIELSRPLIQTIIAANPSLGPSSLK